MLSLTFFVCLLFHNAAWNLLYSSLFKKRTISLVLDYTSSSSVCQENFKKAVLDWLIRIFPCFAAEKLEVTGHVLKSKIILKQSLISWKTVFLLILAGRLLINISFEKMPVIWVFVMVASLLLRIEEFNSYLSTQTYVYYLSLKREKWIDFAVLDLHPWKLFSNCIVSICLF